MLPKLHLAEIRGRPWSPQKFKWGLQAWLMGWPVFYTSSTNYGNSNTMGNGTHFLISPGPRNAGNEGCRVTWTGKRKDEKVENGKWNGGKVIFRKSVSPFRCSQTPTCTALCISQHSTTTTRLAAEQTPHPALLLLCWVLQAVCKRHKSKRLVRTSHAKGVPVKKH